MAYLLGRVRVRVTAAMANQILDAQLADRSGRFSLLTLSRHARLFPWECTWADTAHVYYTSGSYRTSNRLIDARARPRAGIKRMLRRVAPPSNK